MLAHPPLPTPFPYTTLFRSDRLEKRTLRPKPETLLLQQGELSAHRGHRTYILELRDYPQVVRSEEHTSELQSRVDLVCRLLLEKKKTSTASLRTLARRNSPA